MLLITDTFIGKEHFREVVTDSDFVAFQCEVKDLAYMHLNLCEWVRQLEAEMKDRGIEFLSTHNRSQYRR